MCYYGAPVGVAVTAVMIYWLNVFWNVDAVFVVVQGCFLSRLAGPARWATVFVKEILFSAPVGDPPESW